MNYYTYSVQKQVTETETYFEVVETPVNGDHPTVVNTCVNEVDANAHAYYYNAYEKYHNHHLASLATAKWLAMNGLRTVQTHVLYFDSATGTVDTQKAFNHIWEAL